MRELQNVIERACALADGEVVTRRDLPEHTLARGARQRPRRRRRCAGLGACPPTDADLPLKDAKERWLQVLEAAYLRDLLDRHDGNISAAAKVAGIDRKTFHRLVHKYQVR